MNILDARDNLSRLVAAASRGEEVVIAKRGVPVVRLVALERASGHTAIAVAEWLATHSVPGHSSRTAAQLDEQIATERSGWE